VFNAHEQRTRTPSSLLTAFAQFKKLNAHIMKTELPDADATVKQVESLGGKTFVKSNDIPNVGRFAILGDPDGAVFAVFTRLPSAASNAGDEMSSGLESRA
jgi:predicted enzyme related to lactoylglutathione lyase